MLDNTRVACASENVLTWCKKKKDLLSHYEFRKAMLLALIAREEFSGIVEPGEKSVESSDVSPSTSRQDGRPEKKRRVTIARSFSVKRVGSCRVSNRTLLPTHRASKCRLSRSAPINQTMMILRRGASL